MSNHKKTKEQRLRQLLRSDKRSAIKKQIEAKEELRKMENRKTAASLMQTLKEN